MNEFAGRARILVAGPQALHLCDALDGEHGELIAGAEQHHRVCAFAAINEVAAAQTVDQISLRAARDPVGLECAQQRLDGKHLQTQVALQGAHLLDRPEPGDGMGMVAGRVIAAHRAQPQDAVNGQALAAGPKDHGVGAVGAIDEVVTAQPVDEVVAGGADQAITQA